LTPAAGTISGQLSLSLLPNPDHPSNDAKNHGSQRRNCFSPMCSTAMLATLNHSAAGFFAPEQITTQFRPIVAGRPLQVCQKKSLVGNGLKMTLAQPS
jgi:hypothetical protein